MRRENEGLRQQGKGAPHQKRRQKESAYRQNYLYGDKYRRIPDKRGVEERKEKLVKSGEWIDESGSYTNADFQDTVDSLWPAKARAARANDRAADSEPNENSAQSRRCCGRRSSKQ